MEVGLTPAQFWDSTWYELDLLSKQAQYQQEQRWNHTRHIMVSLGGGKPTDIIKLPMIDTPKELAQTTPDDARRIVEKYKNRLK